MKIRVDELIYDENIYPRQKINNATVESYCEALSVGARFPPLEIQRVINYPNKENEIFVILDGIHRWDAYKRNKIEEVEARQWKRKVIDYRKSQAILLLESAERNRTHGDRLTDKDKKDVARKIAKTDLGEVYTEKEIAEKLGVVQPTVSGWISDIRAQQKVSRDAKILRLSRLGWTREEIAKAVGLSRTRITEIVGNIIFDKTDNLLAEGRSMDYIAKHYHIDLPLAWAIRLEGKTDQEKFKELGWGLRTWNQWNFNECDDRFGDDWPGRIPAQLVGHTLFYFSKKGEFVLDPMAGGGFVSDTCLLFESKCKAFDLTSSEERPEIQQFYWDVGKMDWPDIKKPDLIFFDPPYFTKKEDEYREKSIGRQLPISSLNRESYLEFFYKFFSLVYENSKPMTRIAFLNADWRDFQSVPALEEDASKSITVFDFRNLLLKVGWRVTHRIECPMSTERFSGNVVSKMQEKRILGTVSRTLLIARR